MSAKGKQKSAVLRALLGGSEASFMVNAVGFPGSADVLVGWIDRGVDRLKSRWGRRRSGKIEFPGGADVPVIPDSISLIFQAIFPAFFSITAELMVNYATRSS